MKRFVLFLAFAVAGLALSAEEAYSLLYWMVEEDPSAAIPFEYAHVVAVKEGEAAQYLRLYDADSGQVMQSTDQAAIDGGHATPATYGYLPGEVAAWSGYSFFIELLNDDGGVLGTSKQFPRSYSSLESSIIKTISDQPTVWRQSSFEAVPEPTSGLLMLLGVAVLSLRRKRISV